MPRVSRERTKHHHQVRRPDSKAPSLAASTMSMSAGETEKKHHPAQTAPKSGDIVSAPISVNVPDPQALRDSSCKNAAIAEIEEKIKNASSKKEKRALRHLLWTKKMNGAKIVMKEQRKKMQKEKQKSVLLRGMDDMLDDIKRISSIQQREDGEQTPNARGHVGSRGMGVSDQPGGKCGKRPKSAKTLDRISKEEMQRFTQILEHDAYKSNPLAAIRQHIANTISQNKDL
ncbi:hypothetical protein EV182_002573 [Spiromyces aspiralis]|uniref:Uncharacterized protein n=1 Tax=Spiromyces aspiralis TaxID=68401 RepID=A0ACC1HE86_9FUNG|nr:hypothetical protein EV182_002573 [Spiromyces aspiralis]